MYTNDKCGEGRINECELKRISNLKGPRVVCVCVCEQGNGINDVGAIEYDC